MATKFVLAAAAVAIVASAQVDAKQSKKHRPMTEAALFDEEQADWDFNAGIQGTVGSKPSYQVGISGKWEENQPQRFQLQRAMNRIEFLEEEEAAVDFQRKIKTLRTKQQIIDQPQAALFEEGSFCAPNPPADLLGKIMYKLNC